MNDDSRERELSMDELDMVSGTGATLPLTQRPGQAGLQPVHGRFGIVDDSV
jgi:hypothetical protein